MNDHVKAIDQGNIVYLENDIHAEHLPWNPHSTFKGVALKHLVTGESTGGKLSCHLVRIQAGCEISEHIHETQMELHEILSGDGKGILVEKEILYQPGTSVVIPANKPHKVMAGKSDLYLLAKFAPALV